MKCKIVDCPLEAVRAGYCSQRHLELSVAPPVENHCASDDALGEADFNTQQYRNEQNIGGPRRESAGNLV